MCAVKIVVDSTADISRELRERLGIEMVPLKVHFGEEQFLDGVTIDPDDFYDKLASSPALPTTSQPSPIEFQEAYERILKETPDAQIISYHLSAKFSGTYQSATIGRTMLESDADITVIDSKSASCGFGLIAIRAAELAKEGRSKAEILAEIDRLSRDLKLYFLVDTLEYLQRGGRIGKAAALFGSILNIKPILTIDREGTVAPVDKVRGSKKAMQRIVELLEPNFGSDPVNVAIAWSKYDAAAKELLEMVRSRFNVQDVHETTLGAVIGTHVGPGTAAVFMYRV
ncbi:MAG TPA: DegV family protein [Paenibacillus sp.]|uniref:DegV family protein n=1 Tax=Paenibacillus sp. TaxID=58172 RepID=UPI0028D7C0F9|nr:DegV family protein [Paenibacillus sp.]HUC93419.1 DegV family protein [Paenibacillus sp.]